MKVFILAGSRHVAEALARELHIPPRAWEYPTDDHDVRGHGPALIIEESDSAATHRAYWPIRKVVEANYDRFIVAPMSLYWIKGIDRRCPPNAALFDGRR